MSQIHEIIIAELKEADIDGLTLGDIADTVLTALSAAGYVIVPKVPTEEMVAGATACSLKLGQYEEIWAAMIEEGRSAETGTHNKGKG